MTASPNGSSGSSRASRSYVVPCSSAFRDEVLALAEARHSSAADLARAVLLLMDSEQLEAIKDPGGPGREDRELVVVKSGASRDRRLRRKPRLQVRLPDGLSPELIRKALALALTLERQNQALRVSGLEDILEQNATRPREEGPAQAGPPPEPEPAPVEMPKPDPELERKLEAAEARIERLGEIVDALRFEPLHDGVRTRSDALFVLGFAPHSRPGFDAVRNQFRNLAKIYHPDSGFGDNHRMSQLNDALRVLRTGGL